MMSLANQNHPIRSRHKPKKPTVIMDGIALCFLAHYVVMFLSVSSSFIRLSYALLPLWLFLALKEHGSRQFLKSITYSKSVFTGLCGYSIWLFGEVLLKRSPDASYNWPIMTAVPLYILACYYGCNASTRFWKILRILLVVLGLQAAYSLPYLISGTWPPRIVMFGLATYGKVAGKSFIIEAARHGIGGYDLYMSTAIIVSIAAGLALSIQKGVLKRIFWLLIWA
jgi:hypothetical protein